jgi:hypothetical protein
MSTIPDEYDATDLYCLMMHYSMGAALRPMQNAPRDGTEVVIVQIDFSNDKATLRGTKARVVTTWATGEFIPTPIAANDTSGMNHGALVEGHNLGWLPLPREWPVTGDPRTRRI